MRTIQTIYRNRSRVEQFLGWAIMLFVIYFLIGFASLGQVGEGISGINYMPFWHAPWKWAVRLYQLLGLI